METEPSYIPRRLVISCTLLYIYRAVEHVEQQSNRAAEQTAAGQSTGHMTCARLSRGGPCILSADVRLGVATVLPLLLRRQMSATGD
jgi:hypothetical protein